SARIAFRHIRTFGAQLGISGPHSTSLPDTLAIARAYSSRFTETRCSCQPALPTEEDKLFRLPSSKPPPSYHQPVQPGRQNRGWTMGRQEDDGQFLIKTLV